MDGVAEPEFDLVPGRVSVVLCSVESGRSLFLDPDDPFLSELNEFELSARAGRPISVEEFLEYQAGEVRPWPAEFASPDRAEAAFSAIGEHVARLAGFVAHLPRKVRLVLTTGCEEARSGRKVAYCRGKDAIVVGEANLKSWRKPDKMARLMLHELWHLFSRNCPAEKADACYAVFGFRRVPGKRGAPYPEEVAALRFTNPDGMSASHYIEVASDEDAEARVPLVPLLFLAPYDVAGEQASPFDYMTVVFGVLRMTPRQDKEGKYDLSWVTEDAEEGGEGGDIDSEMTVMVPPEMVPADFWRQVSRNTGYVLHVDEIAAENFVLLAMKNRQCDNPTLLDRLQELLILP